MSLRWYFFMGSFCYVYFLPKTCQIWILGLPNYMTKMMLLTHCQFAQLSALASADASLLNHQPGSYFSDLRQSIEQAQTLICITGWAVWDKLHLLRGPESDGVTLGQLLIDKAN